MSEGRRGLWWWCDKWRRSSAFIDMTLAEQGAYRNLLDEQRLRGGQIPNDERVLAKACGDPLEWPNVRDKVLAKFDASPDGKWLSNRTATGVNAVSDRLAEVKSKGGRVRSAGAKRKGGRFTSSHQQNDQQKHQQEDQRTDQQATSRVTSKSVAVSVAVSGSVTGTETENEPSPAGAGAAPANQVAEEKPWSTEACDDWETNLGAVGSMAGRIGKALKPLLAKHGWGTVRDLWRRACAQAASEADPEYFTPEIFARTFEARRRAPVPRSRGRPSVGEVALSEAKAYLERKGGGG